MGLNRLQVYLIKTPKSSRSLELKRKLKSERFQIITIPAIMINNEADITRQKLEVSKSNFKLIEGRNLSFGEIGCAASHNLARNLVAHSKYGGVILEDDARILNVEEFFSIANEFLVTMENKSSILSLTSSITNELNNRAISGSDLKNNWYRIFGNPPLAVANVITPKAALAIYRANTPIKFVADWPVTKCNYYVCKYPIIKHGDEHSISIINPQNKNVRNGQSIFSWKFLFNFLRNYKINKKNKVDNTSATEIFNWVFMRRIYYVMNRIFRKNLRQN